MFVGKLKTKNQEPPHKTLSGIFLQRFNVTIGCSSDGSIGFKKKYLPHFDNFPSHFTRQTVEYTIFKHWGHSPVALTARTQPEEGLLYKYCKGMQKYCEGMQQKL